MRQMLMALLLIATVLLPIPALSSEVEATEDLHEIYPVSVDAYTDTDGIRCIERVYHLSEEQNAGEIPTGDFERDGTLYHLRDTTLSYDEHTDTREAAKTVKQDCKSADMAEVLKQLDAEMEISEDGYCGTLVLEPPSVTISAKGYKTSEKKLSAARTYENLSDMDSALIPKTVEDSGHTLTLEDTQWVTTYREDGSALYTAAATYTGTSSVRYATGYEVSATYSGLLTHTERTGVYTLVFSERQTQEEEQETGEPTEENAEAAAADRENAVPAGELALCVAGCAGGVASLAAAGFYAFNKRRR